MTLTAAEKTAAFTALAKIAKNNKKLRTAMEEAELNLDAARNAYHDSVLEFASIMTTLEDAI